MTDQQQPVRYRDPVAAQVAVTGPAARDRRVPFCLRVCSTQDAGILALCDCGGVAAEWRRLGIVQ